MVAQQCPRSAAFKAMKQSVQAACPIWNAAKPGGATMVDAPDAYSPFQKVAIIIVPQTHLYVWIEMERLNARRASMMLNVKQA